MAVSDLPETGNDKNIIIKTKYLIMLFIKKDLIIFR